MVERPCRQDRRALYRRGVDTSTGIVRLSDLVGTTVTTADGHELGTLRDLTVRLTSSAPRVARVLVSRGGTMHLVPWEQGAPCRRALVLRSGLPGDPVDRRRPPLLDDELLLARDVLDSQVVDLRGHHLARVAEVLLIWRDGGLEVAALDLGVPALLRRLGLGVLVGRAATAPVDWHDVHLASSRGHALQLVTDSARMHRLDSGGLAELLARLSTTHGADVVRRVGPSRGSAALRRSHPQVRARLTHAVHGAAPAPRPRRLLRSAGWRVHRPARRGGSPGA